MRRRRNADRPRAADGLGRHSGWADADHRSPGTWDGTQPITYGYQWQRCDGAGLNCGEAFPSPPSSSPSYTLTDADLGHTMVAYVTATNSAGSASTHSSVTTTVVTPANTALPTISGTAQEGKTLNGVARFVDPQEPERLLVSVAGVRCIGQQLLGNCRGDVAELHGDRF